MINKLKKTTKPLTLEQLRKRIEDASGYIACVTTVPFCMYESYENLDKAVRILQGSNYKAFVKEWTDPTENQPEGFLWRKGELFEERDWYDINIK